MESDQKLIVSNVRVVRKGSLAQLIERAAEQRENRKSIAFNSSI